MASISKASLLIFLFFSLHFFPVISVEFLVGDDDGWALPSSKSGEQMYNEWASHNRFKVGDTVHFKYEKDSVMVVTEAEYNKCHSAHPILFSNNGDTIFSLDRPGLFYFISGVAGHCERGQKMIIKVLEPPSPPSVPKQNGTSNSSNSSHSSGAVDMAAAISASTVGLFIISFFGVLLF
ncbi:hypothetical protein AAG906_014109 [Vitis piasezkii]|uniref:Early nodulin-like protein 1 n=2 Tax=Vitis vinifera TaxID=29760 RepID=A0A438JYC9_VITVI|eukprot:XP_002275057.1 PREDICTED: mavicyanin [Vitis vinifera]